MIAAGLPAMLAPADEQELPPSSVRLSRWFAFYLRRYFAKHFTAVRVAKGAAPPDPSVWPLVIYTNHASWWDPILFMLVSDALFPGRPGYGPMDAAALGRYGIFRRLGVFGVEADSRRGAVRFLRCSLAAIERTRSILWITAEGRFRDPRRRPVRIASGLAHLARSVERLTVQPLAVEYPFWNERRPEALLRFGQPIRVESERSRSASGWRTLFEDRLGDAMDLLADAAASRDPARFDTLLRGRTGIGGPYDVGRRLRAALRGERFHASHGGEAS